MKTILLIEDNKDVRENTAEILSLSNFNVITAENGKTGVDLALKEHPDLIICDIMMPVMDGYSVLHTLSRNKETSTIPFIFLTAKTERNDLRKGMEMGADDYITKPFDDIELLNAVEARLHKAEALKKDFATSIEGFNEFISAAKKVQQLNLLSEEHEVRHYKKKQLIYEAGGRPMSMFFTVQGKLKNFRTNDDGKELITTIFKEGDYFGYTPLLEERSYQDTVEALEDCEVMLIPKEEFFELISNDSTVASRFIRMLADNLSEREDQLLQLAYNSVRKRVANSLLRVQGSYQKADQANPVLHFTREDLANVVGTATESLIRTLSEFKSERLIEIKDGKISILNEEKLRKMVN
ncbi:MAG: response regulator [Chitinophagaceae bacterium]|nr:response regulator [Chitinophagaceae bacterium]